MANLFIYCADNPVMYSDSSGCSTYPGYYIKKGQKGDHVQEVQQALIDAGFSCGSCGADGIFGSATREAVKAFQASRGLAADGVVGPATWAALFQDSTPTPKPSPTPPPSSGNTVGDQIVSLAREYLGWSYSKELRGQTINGVSYTDCSWFVWKVYQRVGISIGSSSQSQYNRCKENGWDFTNKSALRPGDLVFWKYGSSIGHVGIYIGNGQIIDASSSENRVLIRNLWEGKGFTIVGYGRPW